VVSVRPQAGPTRHRQYTRTCRCGGEPPTNRTGIPSRTLRVRESATLSPRGAAAKSGLLRPAASLDVPFVSPPGRDDEREPHPIRFRFGASLCCLALAANQHPRPREPSPSCLALKLSVRHPPPTLDETPILFSPRPRSGLPVFLHAVCAVRWRSSAMGAARGEEDGEGRCGERCPSWYVSREEIESGSPSRRDGVSAAKEAELRATYCSFIRDVCIRLQL
jgi:hypothetical protein